MMLLPGMGLHVPLHDRSSLPRTQLFSPGWCREGKAGRTGETSCVLIDEREREREKEPIDRN